MHPSYAKKPHHYLTCISQELGIETNQDNYTYTLSYQCDKDIIEANIMLLNYLNIAIPSKEITNPLIYRLPKMHENPYKERFIAGSKLHDQNHFSNTDQDLNSYNRRIMKILR